MQYTDTEAALIGGLISNYFFQPSSSPHFFTKKGALVSRNTRRASRPYSPYTR